MSIWQIVVPLLELGVKGRSEQTHQGLHFEHVRYEIPSTYPRKGTECAIGLTKNSIYPGEMLGLGVKISRYLHRDGL